MNESDCPQTMDERGRCFLAGKSVATNHLFASLFKEHRETKDEEDRDGTQQGPARVAKIFGLV